MYSLTRSQSRQLMSEFPQGEPTRGAPFGERNEPATIAIVSAVGSAIGGVSSLGGLFGGGKSSAPAPMVSKPTVMPTPEDDAVNAAKRKALAGQAQRRGRQSTILSEDTSEDLVGG